MVNQRSFFIYINNQTAQEEMDVIAWSGGIGRTAYTDYAIITTGTGQMDLWVALHLDLTTRPEYYDAILNGLEVFKLQNYRDNSLAALQSPLPPPPNNEKPAGARKKGAVPAAIAGTVGAFALLLLTCFGKYIIGRWKEIARNYRVRTSNNRDLTPLVEGYNLPSVMCHHFTFKQIQDASNNFDETFLLGKGGFGNVYRGKIDGGVQVAIKRGNPLSQQGLHEFRNEIGTLSMLRHRHLVSLIGYCEQNNEMILVYDYMAPFRSNSTAPKCHLCPGSNALISASVRLEGSSICTLVQSKRSSIVMLRLPTFSWMTSLWQRSQTSGYRRPV
jgi:hypothetical protein